MTTHCSTTRFTIAYRAEPEFPADPDTGGWVILQHGRRLDWPMLTSKDEALSDLKDFRREQRCLAADEASERFGFACMWGIDR